ncbi:MAG: hypothetical protein PHV82_05760 [Victivallaceae bacterium]|nr:hypothetical protein [Victivallaceae bacterium]
MPENKIAFKNVVKVWWKFFWRYAVLLTTMLIANGLIINRLSKTYDYPTFFFLLSISVNLGLNLLVSFLIFNSILGKPLGKSGLVIVPAAVKRCNPGAPPAKMNPFRITLAWWNYFWRFALFAFAIAFTLGALFPIIGEHFGYAPYSLLKYSKYIGNISVVPASLLVFILLMWRSEKRRKLDLIPVRAEEVNL